VKKMSLDNLEYSVMLTSLAKKAGEVSIPVTRLASLLIATGLVTVGQLVLAQITHSITLLTLVHQNIYNSLTLLVSVLTQWKSGRVEESLNNTFGWRRLEVVGGISSLVFLFSLCFATAIEALQTVFHTGHGHLDTMHHPDYILFVVGANLGLWLVSFLTVGGFSHHQTSAVRQRRGSQPSGNHKTFKEETERRKKKLKGKKERTHSCSSYYSPIRVSDVIRDLHGCFFTFLTSSLVYFNVVNEEYTAYLDPIIALVYIVGLVWSCVPLVKDSCLILLQTIPGNVEISLLKKYLLKKFPGILSLHDVHTWTFTPGTLVLTGHIMYQDKSVYTEINSQVEAFFYSQGFAKVTIQPEFPQTPNPSIEDIASCTLKCKHKECETLTFPELEDTLSLNSLCTAQEIS